MPYVALLRNATWLPDFAAVMLLSSREGGLDPYTITTCMSQCSQSAVRGRLSTSGTTAGYGRVKATEGPRGDTAQEAR